MREREWATAYITRRNPTWSTANYHRDT